LAAGIDSWPGQRVALVLDDLHAIASTLAESELGRLIDNQPAKLAIVAGTRSQPEFDISRLMLEDELLEITADDLRFRTWEADRLFRDHYDMILGPADVAMLITRTEGWAAGLQLYNLAARDQPLDARRRLIGELSATRVGRDYLARNVLAGLPDDLQTFLIETSALPVLTSELCERVTGRSDCAAVLEHLERNQLFTISVDQRGTYRYHEVLRAHLDACLQQRLGNVGAAAHHRRVGELLESEGRIDDSLHAYSRAGDWSAVSRLVVHRMANPSIIGPVAGDAWIELVPAPIVENDPFLLLARARERTVNGRFAAALRDYDRAATGATVDTLARTCEQERAILAGWADPHAPLPPGWLGELRRIAQGPAEEISGIEAVWAVPLDTLEPGELSNLLGHGLALLIANQPDPAEEIFFTALRHPLADSCSAAIAEFALVLTDGLSAVQHRGKQLEPARIEKVSSVVERCGLGWVARSGACRARRLRARLRRVGFGACVAVGRAGSNAACRRCIIDVRRCGGVVQQTRRRRDDQPDRRAARRSSGISHRAGRPAGDRFDACLLLRRTRGGDRRCSARPVVGPATRPVRAAAPCPARRPTRAS
jgi:hypothetical protein